MQRVGVISRRLLSVSRNDQSGSTLTTALLAFYEQNQHFVVPRNFQVPLSELSAWPQETRGFKLGYEVRKFVRTKTQKKAQLLPELQQIKFPDIDDWKHFQWQQTALAALRAYKQLQGDLLIPRNFVVPEADDRWPRATWKFKLGAHVNTLRSKKRSLKEYQLRDLEEMEFIWVVSDYTWEELFLPALQRYKEVYGHTEVPQSFVIGEDSEKENWPENLRGYRLGRMVNRVRAFSAFGNYVTRDKKKLEELGFWLNSYDQKWQEKILPAFKTFHTVHGHCHVDAGFIVPEEEPWPQETWGIRLGFIAQNIRSRGDYIRQVARDLEELEEIGFVWNVAAANWASRIMPALTTFVLVHGHPDVPRNFVVPSLKPWPEVCWGLKLGGLVADPAKREKFSDFIEIDRIQLEALGFFWSAIRDEDAGVDNKLW